MTLKHVPTEGHSRSEVAGRLVLCAVMAHQLGRGPVESFVLAQYMSGISMQVDVMNGVQVMHAYVQMSMDLATHTHTQLTTLKSLCCQSTVAQPKDNAAPSTVM